MPERMRTGRYRHRRYDFQRRSERRCQLDYLSACPRRAVGTAGQHVYTELTTLGKPAVMTDNQTLNFYDDNVETYRRLVDKLPELVSISQFTGRLSPGALILDLGCGTGNAAAQMRDQGFQLVCVDGSPENGQGSK